MTVWRVCLVTRDINHMDCHMPYQPNPMLCYKPHSTVKQAYAHAQRLGLQSARSAQPGKHNRTLTPEVSMDRIRMGYPAVLFRIRIFGVRSRRFVRFFWIRSRIGYHFCSSRNRIIQNGLNTFKFFCVLFFFCENFIDNLRDLMLDDVVYIVL